MSLLHSGFSIVTYGLGSKKSLIHDFHEAYLSGMHLGFNILFVKLFWPDPDPTIKIDVLYRICVPHQRSYNFFIIVFWKKDLKEDMEIIT